MYNKLTLFISLDNLKCRVTLPILGQEGWNEVRDTSICFAQSEKITYPTQKYKNIRHAQHTTDIIFSLVRGCTRAKLSCFIAFVQ